MLEIHLFVHNVLHKSSTKPRGGTEAFILFDKLNMSPKGKCFFLNVKKNTKGDVKQSDNWV